MTTLFVRAAASGVNALSLETTSPIIVRPSGVVPTFNTFTSGDAFSNLCAMSTASAYGAVRVQSDFSPVVNRSGGDAFVLAASAAAALAAGGSMTEWGPTGSWARQSALRAESSSDERSI